LNLRLIFLEWVMLMNTTGEKGCQCAALDDAQACRVLLSYLSHQ